MTILITGATGFIGYHLSQQLLDYGEQVVGIDIGHSPYYTQDISTQRLNLLRRSSNFLFFPIDVVYSASMLMDIMKKYRPTVVVHLAACASIPYAQANPRECIMSNVMGMLNVMEACKEVTSVTRVIYPLTSGEQGVYKLSKDVARAVLMTYNNMYCIPVTTVRMSTVYGEWGRPDMAVWRFTEQILQGDTLTVYNEGLITRDFTHIDDIVQGICLTIYEKEGQCQEYDLGLGQSTSLIKLIQTICKHTCREADINYVSVPEGHARHTWVDLSAIQRLGYTPQINLDEGIYRFVNWYKQYKHAQDEKNNVAVGARAELGTDGSGAE